MPLAASLRKRLSHRNLHDLNDVSSNDDSTPTEAIAGGGLLRPQSAAASRSNLKAASLFEEKQAASLRPATGSERPASAGWKRFSLLQQRHASDPQLAARYHEQAPDSESSTPPACPAPVVGLTAANWDKLGEQRPKRKLLPFSKQASYRSASYNASTEGDSLTRTSTRRRSSFRSRKSFTSTASPDTRDRIWPTGGLWPSSANEFAPLGSDRVSSDISPNSPATPSASERPSSSKLFKLARRKKPKKQESLFPLPVHLSPSNTRPPENIQQTATIFPVQSSPLGSSPSSTPYAFTPPGPPTPDSYTSRPPPLHMRSSQDQHPDLVRPHPPLERNTSTNSAPAGPSSELPLAITNELRGRAGTTTSMNSRKAEERAPTPWHDTATRTSMTSTTLGRNSIAGLRSFTSKLRHPSEYSPRHSSPTGGNSTKNNSFALSKDVVIAPDREEGESAAQYYGRLEKLVPKKAIGQIFTKSTDPFSHDVLRSLLRTFKFFEEPMDISLRKFLWEIDLPGETQHIDRLISAFAQRYFECNPPLFDNADEVYLLAFSLVVLHSDLFNKSNKHKMQRAEYQKNTRDANVDEEVLGYFYDNIQYTEFINQLDDDAESTGRSRKAKARKKVRKIKVAASEDGEKGKVDPYDFILDNRRKLDVLRPALKGVMNLDDTYHYFGTATVLDIRAIRQAFHQPCVLQTISSRSRPDAFREQATIDNPLGSAAGVVEIKIAKAGVIWRKDPKKKPARSPWQEWGALLTQSQLHFFRNKDWVKDLMKQAENHSRQIKEYDSQLKQTQDPDKRQKLKAARTLHVGKGVVYRPPVADFKADYSIKTNCATALMDMTYDKHKNGFMLINSDDFSEEILLADNEKEMNDWLAKINFASAFSSAKIDVKPSDILSDDASVTVTVTNEHADTMNNSGDHDEEALDPLDRQSSTTVDVKTIRQHAIRSKIEEIGKGLHEGGQKLSAQLKTARHLQILAPFPPDTRSDMLAFGARVAHRVRWTRFEIWRLKSHRDMLSADLINEPCAVERESKSDSTGVKSSPKLLPTALSRLNSKASAIIGSQRGSRSGLSGPRETTRSKLTVSGTDFAGSMDQALSPPAELTRSASAGDVGPFKLPPLVLNNTNDDRPSSSGTESMARKSSIVSTTSHLAPAARSSTPPVNGVTKDEFTPLKKRPSTAIEMEKEGSQNAFGSSPGSRAGNRRSLQRTLRDSREIPVHSRSRRGKDSISSTVGGPEDAASAADREQLSRAPGSFTLHGKKASVITLGSDFQHLPAEERLRTRKQALTQENKQEFSEAEEDGDAVSTGMPASSRGDSSASLLEAPMLGRDGISLEYLGHLPDDDEDDDAVIVDKRNSSSTAVNDLGSEDFHLADHEGDARSEEAEPADAFKERLPGAIESSMELLKRERSSTLDDPALE